MTDSQGPTGIPWYRRRDYPRILSLMSDRNQLPRTYEGWRQRAEALEQRLLQHRRPAMRTLIDPKNFSRWCSANRLKANAHARLLYVEAALRTAAAEKSSAQ